MFPVTADPRADIPTRALGLALALALVMGTSACNPDDGGFGQPGDDDLDGDDDSTDPTPGTGGAPLSWSTPVLVADSTAQDPALQIRDDEQLHVTYHVPDPEDVSQGTLYWVALDGDPLAPSEPITMAANAHAATWLHDGQHIDAAVAGWAQTTLLSSDDGGQSWSTVDGVAATNSNLCTSRLPSALIRNDSDQLCLAFGYDYDNSLFGCGPQAKWAVLQDGAFTEPAGMGLGAPVGAFAHDGGRLVVPTNFGVYTSDDWGQLFSQVPGGDTTRDQVEGTSAIQRPDGAVWLTTGYNWANEYHISVVASDPSGHDWTSPYLVLERTEQQVFEPRIADDGNAVVVCWTGAYESQGSRVLQCRVSRDDGVTWSASAPVFDGLGQVSQYAVDGLDGRVAIVARVSGDQPGLYGSVAGTDP